MTISSYCHTTRQCAPQAPRRSARHGDLWSSERRAPICESYSDAANLEVRFTVPYEAAGPFEVNDPPAAGRPRVGRNAPCPCGSGKKYKKCHLAADTAAPGALEQPDEVNDARLVGRILDWAARRFGSAWAKVLLSAHGDAAAAQLVVPWCAYHAQVGGRRIAERFLDEQERGLSARERDWLAAQLEAWLSIWEVTEVEPGVGAQVTDLLSGETRFVLERTASRRLTRGDTVLARVVDHAGSSTFCGLASRALPPLAADAVVRRVRARLRLRRAVAVDRLRDEAIGRYMLARWAKAVDDLTERAASPPVLQNTDGHELLFTTDHYALEAPARAEVERRLAALGAVDAGETDASERCYELVRPGDDAGGGGLTLHNQIRSDTCRT